MSQFKFQLYKQMLAATNAVYADARAAAPKLGVTEELKGQLGLTGAVSNCHGLLARRVTEAMEAGARTVINNANLNEKLREIVKSHYGDEWDAACVNTCEAGLWVTIDTLFTPSMTGRGSPYRARYIAPYERPLHHPGGYGRPFPSRYKDLFADRGTTPGELGFSGKRQHELDVIFARLAGADYGCHGIKYHPCPLLANVDAAASTAHIAELAARHADSLTGFVSLGYDLPGYGYGEQSEAGVPDLQVGIAGVARQYDLPYVVDNAWGTPLIGVDPRKTGADIMIYSLDKAAGAPTIGLIIGKEELMVPIRRALGMHGDRWGTTTSHGKAAYVTNDPGKEALLGAIASLEVLRDMPESYTEAVDGLHDIVNEIAAEQPAAIRDGLRIAKSINSMAVEINYEDTWRNGQHGIPIFSIEDMYAGSHLMQVAMGQMGLIPTIAYDANLLISLGLGTTDEEGRLIRDRAQIIVRAAFETMQIVSRHAGFIR